MARSRGTDTRPQVQAQQTQAVQPPPKKNFFVRHKIVTAVLVVVAVIVVSQAFSGGSETTAAQPPGATVAAGTPDAPDAPEAPAAPGIGTAVADGTFEFTVTSLEPGLSHLGDPTFGVDAQGQFLLVHVTVTNVGDAAQYFDSSSQKLLDGQSRTHSADSSAAIYLPDSNSFLTSINPGNTVDGIVVFDIPADATPAAIELHDSPFSGGVTVTLS